MNDLLKE